MRYKLLGKTGLRVSELCLGAMIFGYPRESGGASPEGAAAIVKRFAEAGGNFIDTANHYAGGESKRIVGDLDPAELDQLDQASRVPLGFPGYFGASLAYGNTFDLIDDHRRTIDALV